MDALRLQVAEAGALLRPARVRALRESAAKLKTLAGDLDWKATERKRANETYRFVPANGVKWPD